MHISRWLNAVITFSPINLIILHQYGKWRWANKQTNDHCRLIMDVACWYCVFSLHRIVMGDIFGIPVANYSLSRKYNYCGKFMSKLSLVKIVKVILNRARLLKTAHQNGDTTPKKWTAFLLQVMSLFASREKQQKEGKKDGMTICCWINMTALKIVQLLLNTGRNKRPTTKCG